MTSLKNQVIWDYSYYQQFASIISSIIQFFHMLRGQNYSSIVRQNYLLAVQLNHLSRSPTSIQTKIDPNFAASIETAYQDPSKIYISQMKSLHRDDLQSSLLDQAEKLNQVREEGSNKTNECQARLDGVLSQLQKNNLNYSLSLQKKMNRQQERKKKFVDQDRLKNSKIQRMVQKWEDRNLFNHQSDLYQTYQKHQHQNTLEMLKIQRESKIQSNLQKQRQKQQQFENRIKFQKQMEEMKAQAARTKVQNQRKYGNQLSNLAQQKRIRQSLNQTQVQTCYRHNPITNPLQYHVDNPYLLKRMQQRQK